VDGKRGEGERKKKKGERLIENDSRNCAWMIPAERQEGGEGRVKKSLALQSLPDCFRREGKKEGEEGEREKMYPLFSPQCWFSTP